MKKNYEEPELELIKLDSEDIIVTSGDSPEDEQEGTDE